MSSTFEQLTVDDACMKCGRNRDLVSHDLGEVCRYCATDVNRRRAVR
jgi:DNA-directed RNA polymerase subunit RPC12/RpoP